VSVRYLIDDVDVAVEFYTKHFCFSLEINASPAFASVVRGNLRQRCETFSFASFCSILRPKREFTLASPVIHAVASTVQKQDNRRLARCVKPQFRPLNP